MKSKKNKRQVYINDTEYTPTTFSQSWFSEHPDFHVGMEKEFVEHLKGWFRTNNPEPNLKGERFEAERFRDSLKSKIESECRKKADNARFAVDHTKGWLKRYKASPDYKDDLKKRLLQDGRYQSLKRDDYQNSEIFQKEYQALQNEQQDSFIKAAEDEMLSLYREQILHAVKEHLKTFKETAVNLINADIEEEFNQIEEEIISGTHDFFDEHEVFSDQSYFDGYDILEIVDDFIGELELYYDESYSDEEDLWDYYAEILVKNDEILQAYQLITGPDTWSMGLLEDFFKSELNVVSIRNAKFKERFTEEYVANCFKRNEQYLDLIEKEKERKRLDRCILNHIPDSYEYLFPVARMMRRHFVLHIGPTNSGKTYSAMESFRNCERGVYLGPLRLLAYEVYESSNGLGCACDLLTGEEELHTEGATHVASTIEMAKFAQRYDVCVIDEAQMLSDSDRGGSWTAAILGIQADTIHICMSPIAKDIIIELINLCKDTYTIIEHERKVPLLPDDNEFSFPDSVNKHDALIVFSKRSVLRVAAALQKEGWKTSVIYGTLPYESRLKEVHRFISGKTDVVIATDAIGMGMNLPVERIVFLETSKFDGTQKLPLKYEEIKQIAGRAGRQGIYDKGYFTSEFDFNRVKKAVNNASEPIEVAYLKFPETLLSIDGKLSELLKRWTLIPDEDIFCKQDLSTAISLARTLEAKTDDKDLIYQFVMIPFNAENEALFSIWLSLFNAKLKAKYPESYTEIYLRSIKSINKMTLDDLELEYKKTDLLYNYFRKFNIHQEKEKVLQHRNIVSSQISRYLAKQKLPVRCCRNCGQELPWNYPYGLCEECHDELYSARWYDADDDWYY